MLRLGRGVKFWRRRGQKRSCEDFDADYQRNLKGRFLRYMRFE